MGRGKKIWNVSVGIVQLIALAVIVVVNRLTCFTREPSIWERSQPSSTPPDPDLKKLLQDMEGEGDELADDTVAALYKIGGIPAVEVASRLMQERPDQEADPVCCEDQDKNEAICRCVRRLLEGRSKRVGVPDEIDDDKLKKIGLIIRNYLDRSTIPPRWMDPDLIVQAEEVFKNHGMLGFTVLGCASLPTGYAAPEAARVLGFTQQLADERVARRRLIETTLFVMNIKDEGGMRSADSPGMRGIQSVRLMHAGIRHLLLKPPPESCEACSDSLLDRLLRHPWDRQRDGMPIHQVIMCATILSFSYMALRSFRYMGFDLEPEQEKAYLHCWNVAGHHMGIREDLLARLNPGKTTMADAEKLFDLIWQKYRAKTTDDEKKLADGKRLTKTLLEFLEEPLRIDSRTQARLGLSLCGIPVLLPLDHAPRMLIRALIGKEGTDVLGIKLAWWERFLVWLVSPTLQRLPRLRKYPWFKKYFKWLKMPSEEVAHQMFKGFLVNPVNWPRGDRPAYAIPTRLDARWRQDLQD